ncbi:hypothetical protein Ferp_1791 [Ferroglobus placidus DSM 10642]|uniref:DUF2330 domain-containing protein n=1 Tax=Ferroglobus placidus (strain DSM 10642 / AEDII12DO) TaxID=589924 RepID=D3RZM1_FERPA|nr:DUF2330 domain-containing protein [Ferroglobus placidus]ADC65934.1 hypothetical protein Ferp_1791 [Ferroglobus placidus DSM 10642]
MRALVILLFILITPVALADRGGIPLTPAFVEETEQNAIVAWNGEEEILILSTNLRASENTTILELLPLPSKPEIKEGDEKSFYELIKLAGMQRKTGLGFGESKGGVEIIFQERIGVHFITVVRINSSQEFAEWFEGFVTKRGYNAKFPESLESLVEDYVRRGYSYFAIDLISVGEDEKSVKPIVYRFKTDKLYYPLKVSSTFKSDTRANVFILAKGIVREEDLRKAGLWRIKISDMYVYLSKSELERIDKSIAEILDGAYLSVAVFYGSTERLKADLEIEELSSPTLLERVAKLVEGTTLSHLILSLKHIKGSGVDPVLLSILIFSTFSGFPAIFYVIYKITRNKFDRKVSILISTLSVAFVAFTKGFLSFLAFFALFFLGIVFVLYVSYRVITR